jgi:hypothetical protein
MRRAPLAVRLWFAWAFSLLIVTGLLLPRVIEFTDFSERAPFSLLGIFVMLELAIVLFGVTVALQRKRIAHGLTIGIAALAVPILAGLPPAVLDFPAEASRGWLVVAAPTGVLIAAGLIIGLLRPSSRAWFDED